MTYYASFPYSSVNAASTALLNAYGNRISVLVITDPGAVDQSNVLQIDTNDSTITAADISATITNAIGEYAGVGTSPGSSQSGLNMGAFLNSWGDAIRKFLASLQLPSLSWLWLVAIALVVLLFAGVFTAQAGKGFGAGVAAKV